ncbi:hypothetical protein GCWU000342_01967 [Shuttleworthella satelles DSM 14600]|uniref:Uncharacterized protein n=1 Tax=Shuttleworthella satelles DSM 14600 TaxID=626523 RepID=C4GE21_9FIRM|nr:hypothetical protein GCWU000342_01967 [Shuttleworthia satelles DSM 14600]
MRNPHFYSLVFIYPVILKEDFNPDAIQPMILIFLLIDNSAFSIDT